MNHVGKASTDVLISIATALFLWIVLLNMKNYSLQHPFSKLRIQVRKTLKVSVFVNYKL